MKVGIMSDIHDNAENLLKAVALFNKERVDVVICCGDWVSPFILKFIEGLKAPVKTVFGNNEGDKFRILQRKQVYKINLEFPQKDDNFLEVDLAGKKAAVFHGNPIQIAEALVNCGKYDVVFTGHNHTPHIKKIGNTLWVNPGTISNIRESQIVNEPTIAICKTEDNSARIMKL